MTRRNVNMLRLILLALTAGVPGHMPDRFIDEPHLMTRNVPDSRAFMCGLPRKNINYRSSLSTSRKYMGDMPHLDNNVKDVSHLNEPVSDVPDMDTCVNDVSNPDRYVLPLNTFVVDKLNLNTYTDDEPMTDKNMSDEPEADESVSDDSDLEKILGGRYATQGEVPWVVNILANAEHGDASWRCGGSIVNAYWILTVAHCIISGEIRYRVIVGDYMQSRKDPEEQTFEVDKIIIHEYFRYASNDIALLKIQPQLNGRGIIFGKYVQPVCLPNGDSEPRTGTEMVFTGWGIPDARSDYSDVLKLSILPTVEKKDCIFQGPSAELFCAGKKHGSTEACMGDAGSPLVYKKDGIYILYGLLAAGHGCSRPILTNAFTNISYQLGWILKTIKDNSVGIDQQSIPVRPPPIP